MDQRDSGVTEGHAGRRRAGSEDVDQAAGQDGAALTLTHPPTQAISVNEDRLLTASVARYNVSNMVSYEWDLYVK